MKNWAGNVSFSPKQILNPSSTETAQKLIQEQIRSNKHVRMRGSAHSWMPLIASEESFLHLDDQQGILEVDPIKNLVKTKAGTKLWRLGEDAFKHKLALPNQGDIDRQSIAGAISTGTHGTGITLQSISNQIQNLTMITGTGDILNVDAEQNPDLMNATAVSFGSLGLMTEVTLKMIPAYKLKVETWTEDMRTCMTQVHSRMKENRHLEMFYFPLGDWCIVKTMNMTTQNVSPFLGIQKIGELLLDNWLYECLHFIAHKTNSYNALDKIVRKFAGEKSYVNWSHKAFPAQRTIRFMEMEYNLPIEKFEDVLEEITASIRKNKFQTLFPIEIRFVKGDDLWLSPAYQRDSVYFAVHTYIKQNFRPYFDAMESIFKRHGGRPHWGKWHSMNHSEFERVYPKWNDFLKLRSELDSKGFWLNNYLRTILC